MTTTVQKTYTHRSDIAAPGLIADIDAANRVISRTSEEAIEFGLGVFRGTDEENEASLSGSLFLGVAVRDHAAAGGEDGQYNINEVMGIITEGAVWIELETTGAIGDALTIDVTTGRIGTNATGGRTAGAVVPDGGNTGDGTVTAFAIVTGETPLVGDFLLECVDADEGGTATGGSAFAGTGNGTISAIVAGSAVLEGDYILTCIDATASGSEIFEVIGPNGKKYQDVVVGVAYLTNHLGLTLTDGSTDFIVGDKWTITITIAHGGQFVLTDPKGVALTEDLTLPGGAGGTLDVEVAGIEFTITDGATDFAVGDLFTLPVTDSSGNYIAINAKLDTPAASIDDLVRIKLSANE